MKQYKIEIGYEGYFSYSWGYALYSAFLDQLREEESNRVHEEVFFNQYVTPKEWVVSTEGDFIFQKEYFLHKYNKKIQLGEMTVTEVTEQELADKFLVKEPFQKRVRLRFLTPTTFKQNGDYVLFPTKDLIMQSLTNKWNEWAQKFVLEDVVWDNCKISRYDLKSVNYNLKGAKIPGFIGYVDLAFWGSESMIRLGNMICEFGNYSGVGIKSTLGMGGTKIE